jgi:hypothetical protein
MSDCIHPIFNALTYIKRVNFSMQVRLHTFASRFRSNSSEALNIQLNPDDVIIEDVYIDGRSKAITIPDIFHQPHCLVSSRILLQCTYPDVF